jgi:hypothetical protein
MTLAGPLHLMLFWPLLCGGLLLPGWLLGRWIHSPAPMLSSFLGSAVLLFYLGLGLDALGLPLSPVSFIGGLAVLAGILFFAARRFRSAKTTPTVESAVTEPGRWEWPWLIAPALGLLAVTIRAGLEPLSGYDNIFRWDFLAREMLRTGTLAYYPPMTAADFTHYGWCDGIPPLVSMLNLWSYLSAGQMAPLATTPRVILEAGLLFYAVGRLARGIWGAAAGGPATSVLAASSLLLWGVAIGQETGLTALTLVAMFLLLDEYRRGGEPGNLFWAGLAAGAGALSREYGLVWPVLGLFALAWQGGLRAGWRTFGFTAALVAAPWYLRNWIHTGNPLFSQGLAGLFPVNPVHAMTMRTIAGLYSVGANPSLIPLGGEFLAVMAGLSIGLGLCAIFFGGRRIVPLVTGIAVVAALWAWSIGQTAGGWLYATRVLTPAIALCAVLAGGLLSRARAGRGLVIAVLIAASADAALRSLQLPNDPLVAPWRLPFTHWRDVGTVISLKQNSKVWPLLAATAGPRGFIVDNPVDHALLVAQGARAVPLASPELAGLFGAPVPFQAALAQLRAQGFRFVILTPHNPYMERLVGENPFLHELRDRHTPAFGNGDLLLYDLDLIAP